MEILQFCRPSDEDLIQKFLLPKNKNGLLPYPSIVREFDQFGSMHPYQIWEMYNGSPDGKTDLYFFVKSNQPNRRTIQADGSRGTWRNDGIDKVFMMGNQTIGKKRRFRYKNPGLPAENGSWNMFEYSLEVEGSVSSYVICKLRKKAEKKKSQTNSQHEEDVENYGFTCVTEFPENLQNPGSTSHRQDHSVWDPEFILLSELVAANPSAFPEPQSPSYRI